MDPQKFSHPDLRTCSFNQICTDAHHPTRLPILRLFRRLVSMVVIIMCEDVNGQYDELIATCGLLRPSGFIRRPRSGVKEVTTVCGYLQITYIFILITSRS
jgi:hypothetical protein